MYGAFQLCFPLSLWIKGIKNSFCSVNFFCSFHSRFVFVARFLVLKGDSLFIKALGCSCSRDFLNVFMFFVSPFQSQINWTCLEVEPSWSASYVDICQLCAAITISKENAAPCSTASLFKTPGKPFCFFSAELVNVFALSAGSPDR